MQWAQVAIIIGVLLYAILICSFYLTIKIKQITGELNSQLRDFDRRLCRLEERYLDIKERK